MHARALTMALAFLALSASLAFAQIGLGDQRAPIREGEQPAIPLDTEDPTYNLWRTVRDDLDDGREPGIINIQRFIGGTGWNGIPTFFRLPVALTPADLKASNVDIAFMGAHTDMGGGFRGAAYGPNELRAVQDYLTWGAFSMPHMGTMINPFDELVMADYGDAPNDPFSTERTVHEVRKYVADIAGVIREDGTHVIPFIIGGDHSLMYPDVAALTDIYGRGNVGVIHFDSHYDGSKHMLGHLITHGMPVYRLIEEGLVPGKNFIQIGLRGYYPPEETFVWMQKQGFRYHTMAEVEKRGWEAVLEDAIKEAQDGPEYLFISFDIDVIDPAFMPGTGTPEPGGLTPREVFPIIRRLCAESNVVGFELVEFLPYRDPGYVTALNCNRILREAMVGIAMRKMGITEKNYLSPLTTDHGQK